MAVGPATGWRKVIGAAIGAYGILGIPIVIAMTLTVPPAVATMDDLARASADVRVTLGVAHDAFGGFAQSLVEARRSAERASASARSTAATAKQLADAMGVSILGARPLLPIATGFQQQATDLQALATELDALGGALATNERDVGAIRAQIAVLRDRTGSLTSPAGPIPMGPVLYTLMAWMAMQTIGAVLLGASLWRGAP